MRLREKNCATSVAPAQMNGDEKALLKRWMLYCGLRCFKWMDWIGIGWVSLGGMRYRAPYTMLIKILTAAHPYIRGWIGLGLYGYLWVT